MMVKTWTDWHLIREPLGTSGLKEGAAGAVFRAKIAKSRATVRKVRPITDVVSTALGREEMAVCL
jgi:hypothetical protein